MPITMNRRECLGLISLLPFSVPRWSNASETPIEINWDDLIPDGNQAGISSRFGIVEHGQMATPIPEGSAANVTQEYNGKIVRIPGYIVPLDYEGTGTKQFLLVPYVGACIHVPPPPANQLILVTADEPYELERLFDAVYVTGTFDTASTSTELAEVGYSLSANKVEPYE